jgi:hypothetical protein
LLGWVDEAVADGDASERKNHWLLLKNERGDGGNVLAGVALACVSVSDSLDQTRRTKEISDLPKMKKSFLA